MASATRQARGRNPLAPAPPSSTASSPLSDAGDSNASEDNATNGPAPAPTPVVTMSAEDLRVIQQQIADLQAAVEQNPRRRRRSDSE